MIIVAYCGRNFKDCLEITSQSWGFCKNFVFTDTDEFGTRFFDSETTDFKESCRRRILCLQKVLLENKGEEFLLLDADVMVVCEPSEVFRHDFDLALTRVVQRRKSIYDDANIGVVFCRSNERTLDMCERWLALTEEYSSNEALTNPDQTALTDIAMQGYDGVIDLKVTNFSENLYNFERNDIAGWTGGILKYKPKMIHMKNGKWKNKYCVNWLKSYVESHKKQESRLP
jgi:hypothetical protein